MRRVVSSPSRTNPVSAGLAALFHDQGRSAKCKYTNLGYFGHNLKEINLLSF